MYHILIRNSLVPSLHSQLFFTYTKKDAFFTTCEKATFFATYKKNLGSGEWQRDKYCNDQLTYSQMNRIEGLGLELIIYTVMYKGD